MEIGDYVTRNSYHNDTLFKVINKKKNILYLKGVEYRLYADAPIEDCVKVNKEDVKDEFIVEDEEIKEERDDFFYLPPRILHLDSDSEYMKRCMDYYKRNHVLAIGKKIEEKDLASEIGGLLNEFKPDIVIITGHDSYSKNSLDKNDIKNYKNSLNFVKAVREARKYEKSHDKLIIIAGACQSDYEELIKAGANFASSPKRINIHALDPAIIATSISLTERNKEIDLLKLLSKTRNGKDGIGGLICNGMMFVGYPR